MRSQPSNTESSSPVIHPADAEWMAFLYEELTPATRREMGAHLARCSACAAKVQAWRGGMNALDEWSLPSARDAARQWFPVLKWAAAAGLVLVLGFGLGRRSSGSAAEMSALKDSIARLAELVRQERNGAPQTEAVARTVAGAETLRLLDDYSRQHDEQRATDQQAVAVALRAFDARLNKVRAELETVAVNTQTVFEQTHEDLAQLASFSLPPK